MSKSAWKNRLHVHYRVGSLEKLIPRARMKIKVHYRVGSLEKEAQLRDAVYRVHYRVGSLEILNILWQ